VFWAAHGLISSQAFRNHGSRGRFLDSKNPPYAYPLCRAEAGRADVYPCNHRRTAHPRVHRLALFNEFTANFVQVLLDVQ